MQYSKKQCYHLEPPAGLMNDPNGLVWFRGRYYVFFQWKQRFTRGYKRYKETSGLTEWKIGHIFHSIFT